MRRPRWSLLAALIPGLVLALICAAMRLDSGVRILIISVVNTLLVAGLLAGLLRADAAELRKIQEQLRGEVEQSRTLKEQLRGEVERRRKLKEQLHNSTKLVEKLKAEAARQSSMVS